MRLDIAEYRVGRIFLYRGTLYVVRKQNRYSFEGEDLITGIYHHQFPCSPDDIFLDTNKLLGILYGIE